jgi:hypothetical protein
MEMYWNYVDSSVRMWPVVFYYHSERMATGSFQIEVTVTESALASHQEIQPSSVATQVRKNAS